MPFGLGGGGDSSPYKGIEHAPLSAQDDDDDDGMPLPPYSDVPPEQRGRNGGDDDGTEDVGLGDNGGAANGGRNGSNGENGSRKAKKESHKAISIRRGYDDDEESYGEGDYYGNGDATSPLGGMKRGSRGGVSGGKPTRYYRTGLVCAYLKHWFTCQCCNCCPGTSEASRNIGGGPASSGAKCFERFKNLFMVLFYIFLLVVIVGCAAGIGYIVAQDGSPFEPDDASVNNNGDAGGDITIITPGTLPPPPVDLHDTCTDWITFSGRQKCQNECDVAKCCALPATDKNSCWEGHAADCATYRAACMALELHTYPGESSNGGGNGGGSFGMAGSGLAGEGSSDQDLLPSNSKVTLNSPKPTYLNQVCSTESLKTPAGFDECSEVCRPSRCCHPEKYGCELVDNRWCSAYEEPCAGVAESWRGSGHAVATESGTSGGSSPSTGGTGKKTMKTMANEVMLQCNSANLNPPDACIEACNPGACCYVSDSYPPIEQLFEDYYGHSASPFHTTSSCAVNVGFCQQFGSCEHLNHMKDTSGWHEDTVTYELDIAAVCKAEYIAQYGALECSNVCQPAHCCFSGEYKCNDVQLGHLDCNDYSQCHVLYSNYVPPMTTAELFKLAQNIDDVCSEDSITSASGRSQCQSLCKERLCCFEDGAYGCANDKGKNCLAYAGCETLVSTPEYYINNENKQTNTVATVQNTGGVGNVDVDEEVDEFVTALEEACSPTSLATLEGIQKCHNKCQTHLCCFTNNESLTGNDCTDMHVSGCSAYKACERLVTPSEQTVNNNNNNSNNNSQPAKDLDAIADSVEQACSLPADPYLINQEWVTGCHTACASRICCLVDARIGSNCRSTVGTRECDAYGPCEVLIDSMGQEMTEAEDLEAKFGDIDMICNIRVETNTDFYDLCEERCNQRSCCFEDKPEYSCYHMEKAWCDEFKACSFVDFTFTPSTTGKATEDVMGHDPNSFVLDKDNNAPTPADPSTPITTPSFKSLCSTPALLKYNREECKSHCSRYECCFRQENACYEKNKLECDEHYVCEEFFMDKWTGSSNNDATPIVDEFQAGIEAACSPDSLKSMQGVRNCFNKCQAHLCCHITNGLEDWDCSDTQVDECNSYSACENLVSQYDLWKPPSTSFDPYAVKIAVTDACTLPQNNAPVTEEWVAKCHQVCEARMCCLADSNLSNNCVEILEEQCDDYSACQVLIGGEQRGENNIDDVCSSEVSSNKELFSSCREKCKERACCFEDSQYYSCYHLEEPWCNEFEACEYVGYTFLGAAATMMEQEDEVVDFEGIDTKCSREYLLAFGLEECEYLCDTIKCCFGFSQCTYPNESDCKRASACDNFYNPKYEDLIVLKLCSEEELENNMEACQDACDGYECCFSDTPCFKNGACPQYEPCRNYFEEYGSSGLSSSSDAVSAPGIDKQQSFQTLCTTSTLQTNWDLCNDQCAQYACCFRRENSCYEINKEECDKYYICEEFFLDDDTEDYSSDLIDSAAAPNFDEFEAGMEAACSPGSLTTVQGIEQCFNKCQAHLCCVPADALEDSRFDCSDTQPKECNPYFVCENLVSQYNLWKPPSKSFDPYAVKIAVDDACTFSEEKGQPSKELVAKCHQVCEARLCCLTDSSLGNNCAESMGEDECSDYSACQVLIGGSERHIDGVEKLCGSEATSDKCREKCKQRSCCFEDTPAYSCYHMEKSWCDEFSACENVGLHFLGSTTTNTAQENTGSVTSPGLSSSTINSASTSNNGQFSFSSLCSPSAIGENWDLCKNHCSRYECCFGGSGNSCFQEKQLECEEYNICQEFYKDVGSSDGPGSPNLSTAVLTERMKSRCTPTNLGQNMNDCEDWCLTYECCFYFSNSCYSTKKQQCDENDFCRSVFDELRKQPQLNSIGAPSPSITGGGIIQPPSVWNPSGTNITPQSPAENNAIDQGLDDTELLILARACNDGQLHKDDSECRMLCKGSECCFSQYTPCNEMRKFCNDHSICSGVFT